jgi:hypothetical protein
VREALIEILVEKKKTEMVLNVLLYADFSLWPQTELKEIIEFFADIVGMKAE